jgi:hypothetical protein
MIVRRQLAAVIVAGWGDIAIDVSADVRGSARSQVREGIRDETRRIGDG